MQIKIHRGKDQIGGCITEIATTSTRILIDLGQNLPDNQGIIIDPIATKKTIANLTDGIDAIFYTHYHGDHIGLFNLVPPHIPQYIGKVAKEICICKHTRLGFIPGRETRSTEEVCIFHRMIPMQGGVSIKINDIKITPYFVSHSAYESFMFLIEAKGKRILHTGDFRDHSYLGKTVNRILDIVGQIDFLITEGTMLSRADEHILSEKELQDAFIKVMKKYKNVFIVSSSTDIERLATIRQAHRKAKYQTPFVTDDFQKEILTIFTNNLKEKHSLWNFKEIFHYNENNSKLKHWMTQDGFTMQIRSTDKFNKWLDTLLPILDPAETCVVFSMWSEYINSKSPHAVESYLTLVSRFTNVLKIHTSGHASFACIAKVCKRTNPRLAILPIHSKNSSDILNLPLPDKLKAKVLLESRKIGDIEIVM